MLLIDLKKWVNKLPDEQLHNFFYVSDGTTAGMVESVSRARADYYEAEGNELQTLAQLKKMGCSQEEIDECPFAFPKGAIVFKF